MRAPCTSRTLAALLGLLVLASLAAPCAADDADLARRLIDPNPVVRAEAVRVMSDENEEGHWGTWTFVGPRVRAALDSADPAIRAAAAQSIGDLQFGGKRRLAKALADESAPVRAAAARALTQLSAIWEADQGDPLPALVRLIRDRDSAVRAAALRGVAAYQGGDVSSEILARSACPIILVLTRDADAGVRDAALRSLHDIEPQSEVWSAPTVSPAQMDAAFERASRDPSPIVRATAGRWFAAQRVRGERAVRITAMLRILLTDPDRLVRWSAATSLWSLTGDPTGLVPVAAETLVTRRGPQFQAVDLLSAIGPDAQEAVPALVQVLGTGKQTLYAGLGGYAVEALYDIGPESGAALPLLEEALRSPAPFRRIDAAEAMAAVHGEPARRVAAVLAAIEVEKGSFVRAVLLRSLAHIAPGDPLVVQALARALEASPEEQEAASLVLEFTPRALLAPYRTSLVPLLLRLASSMDKTLAARAARALRSIEDPSAKTASVTRATRLTWYAVDLLDAHDADLVPDLMMLLHGKEYEQENAAKALGRIGNPARSAAPSLLRVATQADGSWPARIAAAEALVRIDSDPAPGIAVLLEGVAFKPEVQGDDSVSANAAFALARLGSAAKAAAPMLHALAHRQNPVEELAIALALTALTGEVATRALDSWAAIEWNDPAYLREAVRCVASLGPKASPFFDRLIEAAYKGHEWTYGCISNPGRSPLRIDLELSGQAMKALGACGPSAREALPALRQLRADTRLTAAADAAIALIDR